MPSELSIPLSTILSMGNFSAGGTTSPEQQTQSAPMPQATVPQAAVSQEQMGQGDLPGPVEYKKQQSNLLATLIPQIMNAVGGGDPYIQKTLQEQEKKSEARIQENNMRGFMRSVTMPETGEITPALIMQQAEVWGVNPDAAMAQIQKFQSFRKAKRGAMRPYSSKMPDGSVRSAKLYNDEVGTMPGDWQIGSTEMPKAMSPRDQAFSQLTPDEQKQAILGRKGAGGTNVNIKNLPTPPKGYWYSQDGKGLEVIPGGPVHTKQKEGTKKEIKNRVLGQIQADLVNQKIDSALPMVDNLSTGVPGVFTGAVPGTNAHNLQNTLDTIEANLAFDKLQVMREASPTGGALGAVSERELGQLEKAYGSLKRSQSKEQLIRNLSEMKETYNRVVHGQEAVDMLDVTQGMSKKSTKDLLKILGQ